MKQFLFAVLALATVFVTEQATAKDVQAKPTLESAWARATAGSSRVSAIYGALVNRGADDVLERVEVLNVPMAQIHETYMDENGIMQMDEIENGVLLNAGTHVMLQPGGKHIMLMGLEDALAPGDELALILYFKNAGRKTIRVPVKPMRYIPKDHPKG